MSSKCGGSAGRLKLQPQQHHRSQPVIHLLQLRPVPHPELCCSGCLHRSWPQHCATGQTLDIAEQHIRTIACLKAAASMTMLGCWPLLLQGCLYRRALLLQPGGPTACLLKYADNLSHASCGPCVQVINVAPKGAQILPIGVNVNPAVILINPQGLAVWVSTAFTLA